MYLDVVRRRTQCVAVVHGMFVGGGVRPLVLRRHAGDVDARPPEHLIPDIVARQAVALQGRRALGAEDEQEGALAVDAVGAGLGAALGDRGPDAFRRRRSEEPTSELTSHMRSSYAVFCL